MSDERLRRLEEKVAFLERHVTEQDKAMLELGDEVARLRRQLKKLQDDATPRAGSGLDPEEVDDERPPHY